ncbi:MAG: hypothetical protein AB7F98_05975 [Novosphingobium sp.]
MRNRFALPALAAGLALGAAQLAMAGACRVTDFTDRTLSSLSEAQRLSFAVQMTTTEYNRLKAAAPGSANYYGLIANSASLPAARQAARDRLYSLKLDNVMEYAAFWAHDFLTDEAIRKFADCESGRQPGLALYGRSENPGEFHLTYVHITPIGIEKITTKVIASDNVANIEELKADLAALGAQDNYTARTFVARLVDPSNPATIVMRGGWETPKFAYIPVYPTPDYFNGAK